MMIITYHKITSVILVLCTLSFFAQSQPVTEFADKLYHEGDYLQAVTEYKRAAMYSANDSIRLHCETQTALAYLKSHEYMQAVRFSSPLLQQSQRGNRPVFFLVSGLSFYEQNMPQLALPFFDSWIHEQPHSAQPWIYTALVQLKGRQYESANFSMDSACAREQNPTKLPLIEAFRNQVRLSSQLEYKSPTLAVILSTIVPGAGQFYSHHTYDGVQAFLYTASAALATYSIYKYESTNRGKLGWTYVGISITSLFHLANILSAKRTAEYRNMLIAKEFNDRLYDESKSLYPF